MISCSNISKKYATIKALKDISFQSFVRNLTIVITVFIFLSCKVSKINTSNDFSNEESENENVPTIVFLNCSLVYDSIRNKLDLSLINKIAVEGKLKDYIESEVYEKKDFGYSVLDKNKQVIFKKYMPYPLEKTVEYVDEQNNLRKKDVRLDQIEFSLRISLSPQAKYISFFDRQEKQLLFIDLKK